MTKRTTYTFPAFTLVFDADSGGVETRYTRGGVSGGPPTPEDEISGEQLSISAEYYRLARELAHHLIGMHVLHRDSSFVVYRDMEAGGRGLVMDDLSPEDREMCRWEDTLATALTYYALGKYFFLEGEGRPYGDGLLRFIEGESNLDHLAAILSWLLETPVGATLDLREAQWM